MSWRETKTGGLAASGAVASIWGRSRGHLDTGGGGTQLQGQLDVGCASDRDLERAGNGFESGVVHLKRVFANRDGVDGECPNIIRVGGLSPLRPHCLQVNCRTKSDGPTRILDRSP